MTSDRLLVLTEYFYPDTASGTGRIMTELAEDLVKRGFAISVVCGQPSYIAYEHVPSREEWNGIHVTRLSELKVNRHSGTGRAASWIWFLSQCLVRVPGWRRRYRSILVVTNPAPALAIGWLFRRRRDARYTALVHDVFPENAIAVGKLRQGSSAAHIMKRLNRISLQSADAVITLGRDMKQLLCKDYDLDADKVRVIPNWVSSDEVKIETGRQETEYWRKVLDIRGRFLILYAGNFGFAQDADLMLKCLDACRQMKNVLFCFAGDGGQYGQLCARADSGSIPNLRVVPFQTGNRYACLLHLADCGLVSLHQCYGGMGVPSKIMTYMSAGLPVICLSEPESDLGRIVHENGVGLTCQSPDEFLNAVERMAGDNNLKQRFSEASVVAANSLYARSTCVNRFAEVLHDTLLQRSGL